jgi:hypothetical protein
MHFSTFLKRVLILDAASCLGMSALLLLGTGALAPLFGLDAAIVRGAGLALLPIGLFILWLGTRAAAPAALVYAVIVGNILWSVESVALAATTDGITPLGIAFVTAQAAAVALLSTLEWVGIRRSKAAPAR